MYVGRNPWFHHIQTLYTTGNTTFKVHDWWSSTLPRMLYSHLCGLYIIGSESFFSPRAGHQAGYKVGALSHMQSGHQKPRQKPPQREFKVWDCCQIAERAKQRSQKNWDISSCGQQAPWVVGLEGWMDEVVSPEPRSHSAPTRDAVLSTERVRCEDLRYNVTISYNPVSYYWISPSIPIPLQPHQCLHLAEPTWKPADHEAWEWFAKTCDSEQCWWG